MEYKNNKIRYKIEAENIQDAWDQLLKQVCDSRNGDLDIFDNLCRHFYTAVDHAICDGEDVFGSNEPEQKVVGKYVKWL